MCVTIEKKNCSFLPISSIIPYDFVCVLFVRCPYLEDVPQRVCNEERGAGRRKVKRLDHALFLPGGVALDAGPGGGGRVPVDL